MSDEFAGIPLTEYLKQTGPMRAMPLADFVSPALSITRALDEVHRNNIIHCNLNPRAILIDQENEQARITDFHLSIQGPEAKPGENIQGYLPYIAPEQTGRLEQSLDFRTDLYSLGIVLHEMLTGASPYRAERPMEWIHAHIALPAAVPHEIYPEIPRSVSAIIMKLLNKSPDERYQSCHGLLADLSFVLREDTRLDEFVPGAFDREAIYRRPASVHGRDRELNKLREIAASARKGAAEIVIVTGESGMGKTALLAEFRARTEEGVYAGTFDAYAGVPYQGLTKAVGAFLDTTLIRNPTKFEALKRKLDLAFGDETPPFLDFLPGFRALLGRKTARVRNPAGETGNRFLLTLQRLLEIFADAAAPLILILDDLQWADRATAAAVSRIMSNPRARNLMIICAHRDPSGDPELRKALEEIARVRPVHEIDLQPLRPLEAAALVGEAVRMPGMEIEMLARLCLIKTGGNPFYIVRFLESLVQERALDFQDGRWVWEPEEVRARDIPDDAADWMALRIGRLPPAVAELLAHAACLGTRFDTSLLAAITGRENTVLRMEQGVAEGLLLPVGETGFRFPHDKIREAALNMLDDEQRRTCHFEAGRRMLRDAAADPFDVLNHLIRGFELTRISELGDGFIDLCLRACEIARNRGAYAAALDYISHAMLLPDWANHEERAFRIQLERIECEFLNRNMNEARQFLETALAGARSFLQKAALYRLDINIRNDLLDYEGTSRTAIFALREIGIRLSGNPLRVLFEYFRSRRLLKNRNTRDLSELPEMEGDELRAAMDIMGAAVPATFLTNKLLALRMGLRMFNFSLTHGNSPASYLAYGMYGVVRIVLGGNFRDAPEFGRVTMRLSRRMDDPAAMGAAAFGHGVLLAVWEEPMARLTQFFQEGLDAGMRAADLNFARTNAMMIMTTMILAGTELRTLEHKLEELRDLAAKLRNPEFNTVLAAADAWLRAMLGTEDTAGFPILEEGSSRQAAGFHHLYHLQLNVLLGDFAAARGALAELKNTGDFLDSGYYFVEANFLESLCLLDEYETANAARRLAIRFRVRRNQAKMKKWAVIMPANFNFRYLLVEAGIARINGAQDKAGALHEQAAAEARDNDFPHYAGLALETAAEWYRRQGRAVPADFYSREASRVYAEWGSECKARAGAPTRLVPEEAPVIHPGQLDLLSAINASSAITAEIQLEPLMAKLMRNVLQNAGAVRAVLLLKQDDDWHARFEARAGEDRVSDLRAIPLGSFEKIPRGMIRYADEKAMPLVLSEESEIYGADEYIRENAPASVLCLPLSRGGKTIAMLYLENPTTRGAFTEARLELLKLLSGQMANAIENAVLYQRATELNRAIENLLFATREMSRAPDKFAAATIALHYIRVQLDLPETTRQCLVIAEPPDYELTRYEMIPGAAPVREPLPETQARAREIREMREVDLRSTTLLVPVRMEDQFQGLLEISGIDQEHARGEKDYVFGLASSLALVLVNLRNKDHEKLAFIGRFASEIVHDINNHISVINLGRHLAAEGDLDDDPTDIIESETRLLQGMASDILDFSRGSMLLERREVPAAVLLEKVRTDLEIFLRERRIELSADSEYQGMIRVDLNRMRRVMVNLARNAAEAMTQGGEFRVALKKENDLLYLLVSDTGPGIPPEIRANLFSAFVTHGKSTGTGLGLAAVQRIVKAHEGEITCESEPGRGTLFRIVLPA